MLLVAAANGRRINRSIEFIAVGEMGVRGDWREDESSEHSCY
jgi:hypothetical protein